jgi:hypothetical protein
MRLVFALWIFVSFLVLAVLTAVTTLQMYNDGLLGWMAMGWISLSAAIAGPCFCYVIMRADP